MDENEKKVEKAINTFVKSYSFVIQKYIECPMLINNRKFDIRVWTIIT